MKSIISMFFVIAAALFAASPTQAGYADGMNQYAGYHVMHDALDPMGTEIVTTCDISEWMRESVRVDSFSTDAMGDDQYRYYGDASFEESWIDSEIVGKMTRSPLVFTIEGDDAESCIKSLQDHIDARKEAVSIAEKMTAMTFATGGIQYLGRPGDTQERNDARREAMKRSPMGFLSKRAIREMINHPEAWAMGCNSCMTAIMEGSPGMGVNSSDKYKSSVWIPGDVGYIINLSHEQWNQGGTQTGAGLSGENIIYLGNDKFFGLLPGDKIRTTAEWDETWKDYSNDNYKWLDYRQFTDVGLKSIDGEIWVNIYEKE